MAAGTVARKGTGRGTAKFRLSSKRTIKEVKSWLMFLMKVFPMPLFYL